jgi:ATP synthase protein I
LKNEKDNNFKIYQELSPFMGIGYQLIATVLLGIYAGKYLDDRFETKNVFQILIIILGMIAVFYNLLLAVKKMDAKKKAEKEAKKDEEIDI